MKRPLTVRQKDVLAKLEEISRFNVSLYKTSCPYLYEQDLDKIKIGDQTSVYGLGALTWQIGDRLGLNADQVLNVLKALRSRDLVIREEGIRSYQSPRYWWPKGLAKTLCEELGISQKY